MKIEELPGDNYPRDENSGSDDDALVILPHVLFFSRKEPKESPSDAALPKISRKNTEGRNQAALAHHPPGLRGFFPHKKAIAIFSADFLTANLLRMATDSERHITIN